jgi:peptidoglycan/LPS O-acetylase OafA/YrhL
MAVAPALVVLTPLADVVDVNVQSTTHVPWVWLIVFVALALITMYCWAMRHRERGGRFITASIAAGFGALIAVNQLVEQLFSSFPVGGATGFVLVVVLFVIAYSNREAF